MAIDHRALQEPRGNFLQPPRSFDTVFFQQLNGAGRGQMATGFIGGTELQGGDNLTPARQLRLRQHAGTSPVFPVGAPGPGNGLQPPVHR
ncbi:hypothetical protein AAO05_22635 [Salmonella enterica subsp. enterica serovar Infantis]|nr:hypothetical protein [Salmonella enterica subsp. enterica serovar Infantis]EIY0670547.1 hypothetical protein [Salmonella enterica]